MYNDKIRTTYALLQLPVYLSLIWVVVNPG